MRSLKDIINSGTLCPCPWTGFVLEADGNVKNCVAASDSIGNVNDTPIEEILLSQKSNEIKQSMLDGVKHNSCYTCHKQETNLKKLNSISNRIYYLKELTSVSTDIYDDINNFKLSTVDLRWTNVCNFACVYCGPVSSSRWAKELGRPAKIKKDSIENVKNFVFSQIENLKNIYLAGGEPMMMKENYELLTLLLEKNPDVSLRVNTNLSKTDTGIFDLICKFKNVHWIISVENIEEEFEYVRYGGNWNDFVENLKFIKTLDHKISFNMLWHCLNSHSIFNAIDYFKSLGFHDNAFVVGAIVGPGKYDVRHLPDNVLKELEELIVSRWDKNSPHLLHHGMELLYNHIQKPFEKNMSELIEHLRSMDSRRKIDSEKIFPHVYKMIDNNSKST